LREETFLKLILLQEGKRANKSRDGGKGSSHLHPRSYPREGVAEKGLRKRRRVLDIFR